MRSGPPGSSRPVEVSSSASEVEKQITQISQIGSEENPVVESV
jgi:hypothetical protein